jgi:hypothetical protein
MKRKKSLWSESGVVARTKNGDGKRQRMQSSMRRIWISLAKPIQNSKDALRLRYVTSLDVRY